MENDSASTNELRTLVIHSRSVYSQTRLADFGYIPECKSENPRGIVASRDNDGVAVFEGSPIGYHTFFCEPCRLHRDVARSDILSEPKGCVVYGVHHNHCLICLYDRDTVEKNGEP